MLTKFLNPAAVVAQSGLMQGEIVADLGCGNGFYVLPAAQMVGPTGSVIAVDVMEEKLAATISIANQFNYKNVKILKADLARPLLDILPNSVDMVLVGNILHQLETKDQLIKNIYRILKASGRVMIVEWKKTAAPFGPPLDKRIEQQKIEILLMQAGLRKVKELEADSYHYAVLFEK